MRRAAGGAHNRNRTCDLFLTKEVLYRLSYVSVGVALREAHSMERETGIEPAPSAWKAEVLPLNYSRIGVPSGGVLAPLHEAGGGMGRIALRFDWWREVDSNHRRRKPADLQSAPVGRLGIPPRSWVELVDLRRRPAPTSASRKFAPLTQEAGIKSLHRHEEPGDVWEHPGFNGLHHKDRVFLRLTARKSTIAVRRPQLDSEPRPQRVPFAEDARNRLPT